MTRKEKSHGYIQLSQSERATAARMSSDIDRLLSRQHFKTKAEAIEFIRNLQGKSLDDIELPEPTPAEQAQDLVFDAWVERSAARRIALALQALALWPDCADAYVILAREEPVPKERRRLLELALAAGERAIGPDLPRNGAGHFWDIHETRPYMRARNSLARFLWNECTGDEAAAIEHAHELLRLNPDDNLGIRYALIGWLLAGEDDRGAGQLLARYDDDTPVWTWAAALLEFRKHGDTARARFAFNHAYESNRMAAEYICGLRELPDRVPETPLPAVQDDAIVTFVNLGLGFIRTDGARDWVRDRLLAQPDYSPNPDK